MKSARREVRAVKAVLDTNVLVSGLISSAGPPARLVDALRTGRLQLVCDDRIFAEYQDVLHRDYFRRYFSVDEARILLDYIAAESEWQVTDLSLAPLPDPDDTCFAEVAIAAKVPLTTGNLKHYQQAQKHGLDLRNPAELLNQL
jgi:putative PIN family toxin of toxin-antitoxin system